jgi:hypothetical protein
MNDMDIIEQYHARSASARNYREVAILLLVVGAIMMALYAINRSRIEFWGGVILAAGIILLVVSFALALLSFMRLRCPNCSRVLGGLSDAAFCPGCGIALKGGGSFVAASVPEAKARSAPAAGRAIARRKWEPRSLAAGGDEYPEEAYPKNIRMFTTTDETELTKRYIHLINRDDHNLQAEAGGLFPPKASRVKARKTRGPLVDPPVGKSEGRPKWRRVDGVSTEDGAEDFLSRLVSRIRQL